MNLKPWMVVNDRGYVLCLQCPMDKVGRHGEPYYLALRPNTGKTPRSRRVKAVNWMRAHRRCGFEGLMA